MALDIVSSFRAALFRKKESKPDGVFLLIIKFSFIRFVTTLLIKTLSAFEACVFYYVIGIAFGLLQLNPGA